MRMKHVLALALVVMVNQSLGSFSESRCWEPAPPTLEVADDGRFHVTGRFGPVLEQLISAAGQRPKEIVLYNSPGGRRTSADSIAQLGVPIRVSGTSCTSACALVLTTYDNVCLDETVEVITFHSHMIRWCVNGVRYSRVSPAPTLLYAQSLPAELSSKVMPTVWGEELISLSREEFLGYFPHKRCEA